MTKIKTWKQLQKAKKQVLSDRKIARKELHYEKELFLERFSLISLITDFLKNKNKSKKK